MVNPEVDSQNLRILQFQLWIGAKMNSESPVGTRVHFHIISFFVLMINLHRDKQNAVGQQRQRF